MGQPLVTGSGEAELRAVVEEARERARRLRRPIVASLTVAADPSLDVTAAVFASRAAEERYFAWEQPEREGFAIGALGAAWTIERSGFDRFERAAEECTEALFGAVIEGESEPTASGPTWVGGFAFAPDGGATPEWASFAPGLLVLPSVLLTRHGDAAGATVNVVCRGEDDVEAACRGALARLAALQPASMPLVDPDPVAGYEISSTLPPEIYEQAVAKAVETIREGAFEKVVLAREVQVDAPAPFKPPAVFDALRTGYPSCYCFCVGTPEAAFVGASPELLVRREGARLSTVALAGSTRRSADPAVDDHLGERLLHSAKDLGEHAIVVRTIERALEPLSVWVTPAEEPVLIKVANIQHLATPLRAQLAEPRSVVELAGALHPTSAVGGEPWPQAAEAIDRLEEMDRGWYAGPIGWMDATEDGELCVALRCALLQGRTARCYAGVGVVGDSDPEAELAETEIKLLAVMPALTGS